ncbi:DUF4272 domain-containing protein [Roseovarius sp. 2305UL8-3]|uniref:DUF4272 domain-containing protein n=1 Tax=Roseovarius conchicola TaxID=3121636 RepID=UPI0035284E65
MTLLAVLGLASKAQAQTPSPEDIEVKDRIEALSENPSPDQLARKSDSMKQITAMGVPVLDTLPVIAAEAQTTRRSSDEVAERAMALMIAAVKGETMDQDLIEAIIVQYGAIEYFTAQELAFISDSAPAEQTRVQMTWRYESVAVLLWALGFIDQLPPPDTIIDAAMLGDTFRQLGPDGLRQEARLRPQSEILDQADLIYRLHWAVVAARVANQPAPEGLHPGIIYERHYALNWLYGYMGLDWDNMRTDT